jgi:hypothetical protein
VNAILSSLLLNTKRAKLAQRFAQSIALAKDVWLAAIAVSLIVDDLFGR